ncbi:MAG: cobalamin B12-binding domain-containing protein [Deltaproteobacteria bacterium]|nr:cobalamin B12-binding domain-containing protein [Deltaproteobacteria bacterium]
MRNRLKVMMVTPPYHSGVVESAGVWMPLNFTYLAGHARRAGAEVRILDAMSLFLSHDQITAEVERYKPDVLCTTAITAMEPDAREVCRNAKRVHPPVITVMGNVHATFMHTQLINEEPALDIVVRGEGEKTMEDLVHALSGKAGLGSVAGITWRSGGTAVINMARDFEEDLDGLTPAWDLLDWSIYKYRPHPEGQLAIVSSSRGCRQRCSFCSQQKFWERTWRGRRPEAVVEELAFLRKHYNVQVAMLSDETPTVNRARWERLLDLMIERNTGVELLMETRVDDILRDEDILYKYVKAGVSHVYLGVESTSQDTLDLYKKDTKAAHGKRAIELINQHGMVSETSFVLGTPGETVESIRRTVELAQWYGPDMAFFLAITPWPYADLYEELKSHIAVTDYRHYNLVEPVVQPDKMSLAEMQRELHRATGHFFMHKFMHLEQLPPAKQDFMIRVLKLLIEHSYLGKEMREMAGHAAMPPQIRELLGKLGLSLG